MAFSNQLFDFSDFFRFSCYETLQNSDFFEVTHIDNGSETFFANFQTLCIVETWVDLQIIWFMSIFMPHPLLSHFYAKFLFKAQNLNIKRFRQMQDITVFNESPFCIWEKTFCTYVLMATFNALT